MQSNSLFRSTMVAVTIVCVGLLGYSLFGYGHLTLHIPSGAAVQVNGHSIANTSDVLKLRPGSYHVTVTTARYYSTYASVSVPPFRTAEYTPKLQARSGDSIAYSAKGVSTGLDQLPSVSGIQWFGDTWVVEEVGPSTPTVLVANYKDGRWQKAYSTGDVSTAGLPQDVAATVASKEEAISASNH